MSHTNQRNRRNEQKTAATDTGKQVANSRQPGKTNKMLHRLFPYMVTFLAMWIFSFFIYGEVFVRTAEANFVTTDATQMKFLTDLSWGYAFWGARFLLLSYKSVWAGSIFLSLLLTLTAVLADRALRMPRAWRGVSAIVPGAIAGWIIWRGTSIYYKNEPSLIFLVPVAALIVTGIAAGLSAVIGSRQKKRQTAAGTSAVRPWGALVPLAVCAVLFCAVKVWNENVVLTAKMQNALLRGDYDTLIECGLDARRPTRTVAAYYAIGLEQNDRLLDGIFDIPYDFPDPRLDKKDGSEEYGLFVSDCSFYCGLINTAYHTALEHIVMNNPSLYYLKRLALCAILNSEEKLAEKYLALIGSVPFETAFVEKYRPMIYDRSLVEADPELSHVLSLYPQEERFEQYYRNPTFLGYNIGLMSGSDKTLETAIAASLYTKDLTRSIIPIQILAQRNNGVLPTAVQQAIVLIAGSHPEVAQSFPGVVENMKPQLSAFYTEATPIIKEGESAKQGKSEKQKAEIKQEYNRRLRKELRDDWLGTYFYYYYCENNEPNQVRPATNSGVN